tara:strand:- start:74 stop:259 length:186 start_codon:yes stop_codon:yes gene_type:complete
MEVSGDSFVADLLLLLDLLVELILKYIERTTLMKNCKNYYSILYKDYTMTFIENKAGWMGG